MNLYVIVIYMLSATNGEVGQTYVSSKPMTVEVCDATLKDRGPVPVKDGLAQFAVCKRVEDKVST